MHKNSYLLLIILAILAMLGGIAAKYSNENNIMIWPIITIWTVLFLIGARAHLSTQNWSPENIAELLCGMLLIYSSAQVIHTLTLLPTAALSFAAATYLASIKMKEDRG